MTTLLKKEESIHFETKHFESRNVRKNVGKIRVQ